jgi:hypothetical protein
LILIAGCLCALVTHGICQSVVKVFGEVVPASNATGAVAVANTTAINATGQQQLPGGVAGGSGTNLPESSKTSNTTVRLFFSTRRKNSKNGSKCQCDLERLRTNANTFKGMARGKVNPTMIELPPDQIICDKVSLGASTIPPLMYFATNDPSSPAAIHMHMVTHLYTGHPEAVCLTIALLNASFFCRFLLATAGVLPWVPGDDIFGTKQPCCDWAAQATR